MNRVCVLLAFALAGAWAGRAEEPARPRLAGFTVTTEGGVEGKQVIHYDENGRRLDGGAVSPSSRPLSGPGGRPTEGARPASAGVKPVAAAETAPVARTMVTEDGRKLPFTLEGRNPASSKKPDGDVDFDASLRRVGKESELGKKRFETDLAPIGKDTVYSRDNLMTLDSWHGRYDTYGRRRADLAVEDSFEAEVRPKDTIAIKSYDRRMASVGGRAEIRGIDGRMATEKSGAYDVRPSSPSDRAAPKSVDQLSMQDINKYQFRRNRSDEPGLPVVRPGSPDVQTKGSGGK